MEAKVIREFTCVNTRVFYPLGSTYTSDAARIEDLKARGYVEVLEVAHVPKKEVSEPKTKSKKSK